MPLEDYNISPNSPLAKALRENDHDQLCYWIDDLLGKLNKADYELLVTRGKLDAANARMVDLLVEIIQTKERQADDLKLAVARITELEAELATYRP